MVPEAIRKVGQLKKQPQRQAKYIQDIHILTATGTGTRKKKKEGIKS